MGLNAQSRLSVSGLLLFGTTTSLLAKIGRLLWWLELVQCCAQLVLTCASRAAYELEGVGRDGNIKTFAKPWAMTTVMFLGMSICLPLAYFEEARARRGRLTAVEEPLMGDTEACLPWQLLSCSSIPTSADLAALPGLAQHAFGPHSQHDVSEQ